MANNNFLTGWKGKKEERDRVEKKRKIQKYFILKFISFLILISFRQDSGEGIFSHIMRVFAVVAAVLAALSATVRAELVSLSFQVSV